MTFHKIFRAFFVHAQFCHSKNWYSTMANFNKCIFMVECWYPQLTLSSTRTFFLYLPVNLFKFFSFWLAKMSQTKSYIRTKIVYLEYKCFDIYVQNESLRVPNYFISNKLSFRFKFKLIVKIILNFDVNKCISNWYF